MHIDELVQKIKALEKSLIYRHPGLGDDKVKQILVRAAKVSEEYGELMDEVLSHLELQRQDKLEKYDKDNLTKEFADVMLTILLLGVTLDIDVEAAISSMLENKLQKYVEL